MELKIPSNGTDIMAENFFAPFHGPEGFCPEYKTVIPHPSTS